jgi:hypothetical protein
MGLRAQRRADSVLAGLQRARDEEGRPQDAGFAGCRAMTPAWPCGSRVSGAISSVTVRGWS